MVTVLRAALALATAAAVLAVVLSDATAQTAQTVVPVLVSNADQSAETALATASGRVSYAQSFRTGDHVDGYLLSSVELGLAVESGVSVEAKLLRSTAGESPPGEPYFYPPINASAVVLSQVSTPDDDASTLEEFAAVDVRLEPGTQYWIVVTKTEGADGGLSVGAVVHAGRIDAGGAAGWSVGDNVWAEETTEVAGETSTDWADYSGSAAVSMRIRLRGSEAVRPETGPYASNRHLGFRAAVAKTSSSVTKYATAFKTSAHSGGIEITSVILGVAAESGATPRVAIHEDSSGSPAATAVTGGTLNTPTSVSTDLDLPDRAVFSATSAINLGASKTYWVVLDVGTGSGQVSVSTTTALGVAPTIGFDNGPLINQTLRSYDGSSWSVDGDERLFRMAVGGPTDQYSSSVWVGVPQVGVGVTGEVKDQAGRLRNVSFQWQRGAAKTGPFVDIPAGQGGTADRYMPLPGDLGMWLNAVATYDNAFVTGKTAQGVSLVAVLSQPIMSNVGLISDVGYVVRGPAHTRLAQPFTTGPEPSGYVLRGFRVGIAVEAPVGQDISVAWALHADDNGEFRPAPAPLFDPIDIPVADILGTKMILELAHPGFVLAPGARYWLVLSWTHTNLAHSTFFTRSLSEWGDQLVVDDGLSPLDPGSAAGWKMDFNALTYNTVDPPEPSWSPYTLALELNGRIALQMSVLADPATGVASIVRQTPTSSPTNADSLTWRVTFSEAVSNVDAADFVVSGTTATVTAVAAVSGVTGAYDVTASGGNLAGVSATVTLAIAASHNIQDGASNALSNTAPTGTNDNSYVVDNTAPTVTISSVPATSDAPFTATFTFPEAVTGFAVGDITLGNATASSFTSTSTTVYTALVTPTAAGAVTVDVPANAAQDAAGNGNTAATRASSTYTGSATRGVTVSATVLTVTEGSTGAYTVVLDSQPTANVTVTPSRTGSSDVTFSPATLTFTALNWNTVQPVTVTAAQDGDAVDDSATISHAVTGGDYAGVTVESVVVTVNDDESVDTVPGVPTDLSASSGGNTRINLSWTAPGDDGGSPIIGYKIEVSPDGNANWTELVATGNTTTTYAHIGLAVGTTRHYRVSAINSVGAGDPSNIDDATVIITTVTLRTQSIPEGIGTAAVLVTLNQPAGDPLSVPWYTLNGDAVSPGDYTAGAGQLIIPSGATSATISITIIDDADAEATETVLVLLSPGEGYVLGGSGATLSILDDDGDGPAPIRATVNGTTVVLTYNKPLDGASTPSSTAFHLRVADNRASVDEVSVNGSEVTLTLASPVQAGQTVSLDYTQPMSNPIQDASGNNKAQSFTRWYLVTDSTITKPAITVPGVPTDLSASTGGDTRINLSWTAPGDDGGSPIIGYKIEVSPDGNANWTELVANTGNTTTTYAHIGLAVGTTRHYRVSAINSAGAGRPSNIDDATVIITTVTLRTQSIPEGIGTAAVLVTLNQPAGDPLSVPWYTLNGTAMSPGDYTNGEGTLIIPSGVTSATISITIIDDADAEATETVLVLLSPGEGYALGGSGATLSILDDDGDGPAPIRATVNGTTVVLTYNKSLDGASTPSSTAFHLRVADNRASVDEVSVNGSEVTLTLASPVQAGQTVSLDYTQPMSDPIQDASGNKAQSFTRWYLVTGSTITGPAITIVAGTSPVTEGTSAVFTLSRTGSPTAALTVNVTVSETGGDMVAAANEGARTVTFLANSATATLSVATAPDSVDEADSVVTATVSADTGSPASYSVATPASAMVTVQDNDTRGVTVSATALTVNEDTTGTYTVVLDSQPTANVTVTPSRTGSTDVTFSPATLTFTALNWNTVQPVTVTAAQDSDAVDDSATISHAVTGGDYVGVTVESVVVTVDDDETADTTAPRVASIARQNPTSSPTNADSLTWRVTFSEAVSNVNAADFAVSGTTATVTAVAAVSGVTGGYDVTASGGNLAGVSATVTLAIAASHNIQDGASNALSNTAPTGTNDNSYVVDNTAPTVTISGVPASSDAPFRATFTFSEAVTGFAVGDITLGNATASSFTVTSTTVYTALVTPTATGAVTVDVPANAAQDAAGNGNTAATRASSAYTGSATRGVTVSATVLTVTEGSTGAYTVVLDSQPTANVTVTPSRTGSSDVTFSPATLTFTALNWNTVQPVTVTAAQDSDAVDDSATISHAVTGGDYVGVTVESVVVTVNDDESVDTVPGVPTDLSSTGGDTRINLSWTAPGDDGGSPITGYKIEVSPDGNANWTELVTNTGNTTTTYAHIGLAAGTTRHYRVSAINSAGAGDPSNIDDATTRPITGPITGGGGGGGGGGPSPSEVDFEWNVTRDIEALDSGHDSPSGMWSDGSTLWLAENGDGADDSVYAYDLATGERVESREFALADTNRAPRGIWSDRSVVWVSDSGRERLFAYDLATGERLEEREFALAAGNSDARGIWSDEETMWVLDGSADALFVYDFESGELLAEYELDAANDDPRGIWSDGVTVWVSDHGAKRLFAYRLPVLPDAETDSGEEDARELERASDEEFTELSKASNNSPRGIWSGGDVMYVADESDDRVYTYNMPDAIDARLASLTLSGVDIGEFDPRRPDYEAVVADGVTATTVEAEAMQPRTDVAIDPPDADVEADGHQVALQDLGEITVTVTSADGSRTKTYRVRLGEEEAAGPVAGCLRGDIAVGFSLVVYAGGSIEDLVACAEGRNVAALYVLDGGEWVSYIVGAPELVNRSFAGLFAEGRPRAHAADRQERWAGLSRPLRRRAAHRRCDATVAGVPAGRDRRGLQPRGVRGGQRRGA